MHSLWCAGVSAQLPALRWDECNNFNLLHLLGCTLVLEVARRELFCLGCRDYVYGAASDAAELVRSKAAQAWTPPSAFAG